MTKTKAVATPEPSIESLLASIRQAIHEEGEISSPPSSPRLVSTLSSGRALKERPSSPSSFEREPPSFRSSLSLEAPSPYDDRRDPMLPSSPRPTNERISPVQKTASSMKSSPSLFAQQEERSSPARPQETSSSYPQEIFSPNTLSPNTLGADRFVALRDRLAKLSSAREALLPSQKPSHAPSRPPSEALVHRRLEDILSRSPHDATQEMKNDEMRNKETQKRDAQNKMPSQDVSSDQKNISAAAFSSSPSADMPSFLTPLSQKNSFGSHSEPAEKTHPHSVSKPSSFKDRFISATLAATSSQKILRPDFQPSSQEKSPPPYEDHEDMDLQASSEGLVEKSEDTSKAGLLSETKADVASKAFSLLGAALDTSHPEENGKSIETIAQDLLRPLLRDWLDQNLPSLVERLVSEEIQRITRRSLRS